MLPSSSVPIGSNQSYSTYCKVLRLWSFKFLRSEKRAITNEVVWVLGFYSRQTNSNTASTSCLVYYNQCYYVLYFLKLVSDGHWVCLLRERLPTSFGLHCCSPQNKNLIWRKVAVVHIRDLLQWEPQPLVKTIECGLQYIWKVKLLKG